MQTCYVIREHRAIADLVEVDGIMLLTRVNVPQQSRGQGVGSRLLKMVTDAADVDRVDLWLEVNPSGGLKYRELVAWYKRHGFKWSRTRPGLMVRRHQ